MSLIDWTLVEKTARYLQADYPDVDLLTMSACLLDYISDDGLLTIKEFGSSRDMEMISYRIENKINSARAHILDRELWKDTYLETVFNQDGDLTDKQIKLRERQLPFSPHLFMDAIRNLRLNGRDIYLTKYEHHLDEVWMEYVRLIKESRSTNRIYEQIITTAN